MHVSTALFLWTLQSTNGEGAEVVSEGADHEDSDDEDEEGGLRTKPKGFTLIFDVTRRFAQPLGIHLPEWEGRIIETKKGIVRLLPVAERAEQLFGSEGTGTIAERIEQSTAVDVQGMLFPEMEEQKGLKVRGGKRQMTIADEHARTHRDATTLDRVHAGNAASSERQVKRPSGTH